MYLILCSFNQSNMIMTLIVMLLGHHNTQHIRVVISIVFFKFYIILSIFFFDSHAFHRVTYTSVTYMYVVLKAALFWGGWIS